MSFIFQSLPTPGYIKNGITTCCKIMTCLYIRLFLLGVIRLDDMSNSERAILTYKILKKRRYKKAKYAECAVLEVSMNSFNRCLKLHRVVK